jgi:hypothetical protein
MRQISPMKTLILEGVRAFRDRIEVPLGKITLLVGENSTGKSTVLACVRIAWDMLRRPEVPLKLNEEPFELGTFDSIAHYHGGTGKRLKQFTIGAGIESRLVTTTRRKPPPAFGMRTVETTFASDKGNPVPRAWSSTLGGLELLVERLESGRVNARVREGNRSDEVSMDVPPDVTLPIALQFIPMVKRRQSLAFWNKVLLETWALERPFAAQGGSRPIAFAPVRSRPRRTYDPIHQQPNAEGRHIPALLARLYREGGAEWKRVSAALERFGEASGLFRKVLVRSLGKEGDPFQIEVEIPGQKGSRNLLDVGYGVSQVLPVLMEAALVPKGGTLLLQQPEVHLHPRAQAELGTLLSTLAASPQGPQCIVETHSDYLVDRVAMAVRDPKHPLGPDDVSLLYFQPSGTGVTIYPLRLDAGGDVIDPPLEYRRFFLHEHARYLGLDDEDGA